jgi:hypothetical protein
MVLRFTRLSLLFLIFFLLLLYSTHFFKIANLSIVFWCLVFLNLFVYLIRKPTHFKLLCVSITGMLTLTELIFFSFEIIKPLPGSGTVESTQDIFQIDPLLGYKPIPSRKTSISYSLKNGETVFKGVEVQFDSFGRRCCGGSEIESAEFHALFFGGSYTFGHGIPCEFSLPEIFQSLLDSHVKSYNYAAPGWGTGQMMFQLYNRYLFWDVPDKGIAVYCFIPDHTYRNVGNLYTLTKDAGNFPLFRLNDENTLDKPFKLKENSSLQFYAHLYSCIDRFSPCMRYIWNTLYRVKTVSTDEAVNITVEIISESVKAYHEMFEKGDFYVLIWPRYLSERHIVDLVQSRLEDRGIHCINVPDMPPSEKATIHPQDPHPSRYELKWIADHLINYLEKHSPDMFPVKSG